MGVYYYMEETEDFFNEISNRFESSYMCLGQSLNEVEELFNQVKDLRISLNDKKQPQLTITSPESIFCCKPSGPPQIDAIHDEVNTLKSIVNELIERIVRII